MTLMGMEAWGLVLVWHHSSTGIRVRVECTHEMPKRGGVYVGKQAGADPGYQRTFFSLCPLAGGGTE